MRKKLIIVGAAGRDFHCFNTLYRHNRDYEVVAFTATQIPSISGRRYPPHLSGNLYPDGIPIHPMEDLEALIERSQADSCVFSYSDIHYVNLMQLCNRAVSAGADFLMLAPQKGQIVTRKPTISVLAVRTGCGKSATTRRVAEILRKELGIKRVTSIRHPMPYGDLAKTPTVQRYATIQDLTEFRCSVEEMEEYEPHIEAGNVVYAGVDYEAIVRQAEQESDVLLWDGGNNDTSFLRSDLTITVADPLRAGHELLYWAGETNVTMADVVILNKCDSARAEDIELVRKNVRSRNPTTTLVTADSVLTVEDPDLIRGKRVVVVEDGPTLTHGDMNIGAGVVAAQRNGVDEIVDPRPFAVGSIAAAFSRHPRLGDVIPALGYYPEQLRELEQTIAAVECDTVVIGTPIDLRRVIQIDKPTTRVKYELREHDPQALVDVVTLMMERAKERINEGGVPKVEPE